MMISVVRFLLQNVPNRLRNGVIIGSRVRYCANCDANSTSLIGQSAEVCGHLVVPFPESSVVLRRLESSCDYTIYVDAKTTAGFNASLKLPPLFVARHRYSKP